MQFDVSTDLTQLCRICVRVLTESESENIYIQARPNHPSVHKMLSIICPSVFSKTVEQDVLYRGSFGMPQNVCPQCRKRVVAAYELFQTCVEGDRKLLEIVMIQRELCDEPEQVHEESAVQQPKVELQTDLKNKSQKSESWNKTNRKTLPNASQLVLDATNKSCILCYGRCKSIRALKKHMQKSHANQIVRCDECQDVFFNEVQLSDHKLFHTTGRAYGCHVCEKRFKTGVGLREHIRIHSKHALLLCTVCGKGFNNNSNLRQHALRHSEKKAYVCQQCPSKFYTKGGLTAHMLTHTKERRFSCDECGARFTMKHSLTKHRRIHTGERPYACDVCDQRFTSSDHLKRHMRTHTGEKPYKCTACDRSFSQSNDLVKHSRSHFGDDLYQCNRCESSFRLLSDLRNHYKVHFQQGEKGESEALEALNNRYSNVAVQEIRFTSVSVLKRRIEQKKKRDQQQDNMSEKVTGGETVTAIPVDISMIPTVKMSES